MILHQIFVSYGDLTRIVVGPIQHFLNGNGVFITHFKRLFDAVQRLLIGFSTQIRASRMQKFFALGSRRLMVLPPRQQNITRIADPPADLRAGEPPVPMAGRSAINNYLDECAEHLFHPHRLWWVATTHLCYIAIVVTLERANLWRDLFKRDAALTFCGQRINNYWTIT